MKKTVLFLVIIPFICSSQKFYTLDNNQVYNAQLAGCVDLDETFLDLISVFGDISLLDGMLGCSELIPTLESGILSAFLPFDIPLDCNTDLTPFGYLDINLSDICECSCQKHLETHNYNLATRKLIKKMGILGREPANRGLQLHLYNNGSAEKIYILQ